MAPKSKENRMTVWYLVAYNMAQFLGWSYVFVEMLENLFVTKEYRSTYAAVGGIVRKLQVIAILEVLHAVLGLVRSDPKTALMQWGGRTHVLLSIIDRLPQVQTNFSVFITIAAWATTEIVRYPQYALSSLGVCPKWLTWLRYTMFIVLYPAGIYGEMDSMYAALEPLKDGDVRVKLFDYLPISYHSFIIGLLLVYPFLFLVLYMHMFKQRRSRLGKEAGAERVHKDK
ncbi:unnamed protein product [Calypogeia fissa]